MTDFVLSMVDKYPAIEVANRSVRYAQFLKNRLTKGMFIGDKALIEGCKINEDCLFIESEFFDYLNDINSYNIEDLIDYSVTLTQYALKQLGL